MLISSLYHPQGIVGYNYQKSERTKDAEIYYLHSKAKRAISEAYASVLKNDNARRHSSDSLQNM